MVHSDIITQNIVYFKCKIAVLQNIFHFFGGYIPAIRFLVDTTSSILYERTA